ncbi:hypothetical protein [Humidisolicoccus flavus]|uniref:hypothetical protein n=1 Tax=Humidisolicoccus flavus TaxID=3111414 RepID=UPI003249ECDE
MSELWSTLIPNWIMACAAATAVVAFFADRHQRRKSDLAQMQLLADQISAHWAVNVEGKWGLVVSNRFASAISDLEIQCTGSAHHFGKSLKRATLAPGDYFITSNRKHEKYAWSLPVPITSQAETTPVSSRDHAVIGLRFTYRRDLWRKDERGVATRTALPE